MNRRVIRRFVVVGAFPFCLAAAALGQVLPQTSPTSVLPPAVAQGQRETGTLASTAPFSVQPLAVIPYDSGRMATQQVNQFTPNQPFMINVQPKTASSAPSSPTNAPVRSVWDATPAGGFSTAPVQPNPNALTAARPAAPGAFTQPVLAPGVNWQQPPVSAPSFSSSPAPAQNWNAAPDSPTKGIKYQWQ